MVITDCCPDVVGPAGGDERPEAATGAGRVDERAARGHLSGVAGDRDSEDRAGGAGHHVGRGWCAAFGAAETQR